MKEKIRKRYRYKSRDTWWTQTLYGCITVDDVRFQPRTQRTRRIRLINETVTRSYECSNVCAALLHGQCVLLTRVNALRVDNQIESYHSRYTASGTAIVYFSFFPLFSIKRNTIGAINLSQPEYPRATVIEYMDMSVGIWEFNK